MEAGHHEDPALPLNATSDLHDLSPLKLSRIPGHTAMTFFAVKYCEITQAVFSSLCLNANTSDLLLISLCQESQESERFGRSRQQPPRI